VKTNHHPALKALGDPTRLEIFERVSRKPMAVGEIARELPISRPAVSQHLAVLKAAGLVIDHAEGARRVYRVDSAGLAVLRVWLDRFWDGALGAFKAEVEKSLHEDN
jgi:DNA-binding transcriptional ArsR family regulator